MILPIFQNERIKTEEHIEYDSDDSKGGSSSSSSNSSHHKVTLLDAEHDDDDDDDNDDDDENATDDNNDGDSKANGSYLLSSHDKTWTHSIRFRVLVSTTFSFFSLRQANLI